MLLLVVVVAAACAGGGRAEASLRSPERPDGGAASGLAWGGCVAQVASMSGLECATLRVPVDHDDPDGDTLELAVARSVATGDEDERIGSLVLNPGGPGASGIEWLAGAATIIPPALSDRFDLVSFDPRGVGESAPVRCLDDATKAEQLEGELAPDRADGVERAVEEQTELLDACRANASELIEHMSTADVAADLDDLREALGDEQLTYVGFSYGTTIGATYATLHPERTRAMVLDGAVSPRADVADEAAAQAAGFERTFESFTAACDGDPACPLAPDSAATIDEVRASLEAEPVDVGEGDDLRQLGPDQFDYGLASALYDTMLWPTTANAIDQLREGGAETLFTLMDRQTGRQPDGTFDNSVDARTMVNCADRSDRPTRDEAIETARSVTEASPRFGPLVGWSALSCVDWPDAANPVPVPDADGAPPIVVIGTVGDPATPYEWSEEMAAALTSGVLVTYEGDGHTAMLRGVECIETIAVAYLVDLEEPPAGSSCEAQTSQVDFGTDLRDELVEQFLDQGLDRELAECVLDGLVDELGPARFEALVLSNDVEEFSRLVASVAISCQVGG